MNILQNLILSICILASIGWNRTTQKEKDSNTTKPNILLIVADDMGWADVGYHGSPIRTPQIDRLAKQGVVLEQHYVAPVCTPTRAALLTGRYWSRFGNTTPSNERVLPWETWTLACALNQVGYTTYISGKWHLGSKSEWGPRKFGFDCSYGSLAGGVNPYNHRYKGEKYAQTWHRNDTLIEAEGHVTDLIGEEVVKFIEAEQTNPFFIYVPFTAVHDPFDEPEKWLESASHIEADRRQYAACVQHMDATIGKMIEALDRTGQRENTMVIFFSDNGGTDLDGSLKYPEGKANAPIKGLNHPLRGWKTEVYEGGIRVPAFVHWPKILKPAKINTPVNVTDWMPTICALLDIPEAEDVKWDGMNIWSLLSGEKNKTLEERELYWQGMQHKSAALRQENWKLVVHRYKKGDRMELFDLSVDPYEKNDLSAKQPELVAVMLKALVSQEKLDNDALPNDLNLKN
jgi:arylsulfatase A-like enzyme